LRKSHVAAGCLVLVTLAVYIPAMRGGFVWNDNEIGSLGRNIVLEEHGLYRVWFTAESVNYWPLTWTSYWLEHRIWGLNPAGYHVVNVLIHIGSALLIWGVLRRLSLPGAWMAALVFAIHPVNVESVAWITQRKNTLSLFFCLLAFSWCLRFDDGARRRWYWAATAAFLAAMLSKGAAATFPVVLLLSAWHRREKIRGRDILRSLPFFAIALLMSGVEVWFQYVKAIGETVVRDDSFMARFAGAGWIVWDYLYKAALPIRTCFIYPRWNIDPSNWLVYLPNLALLVVLAACWYRRKSWGRPAFFALSCFVVTLAPVLGFFDIYFMRYSLVADHYQYLSIIAVIALLIGGGVRLLNKLSPASRRPHYLVAAPLVVVLSCLTWRQCGAYQDSEALWRDTLKKNPDAWIAHGELGNILVARGDVDEALEHYRQALTLTPDAEIHNNIGGALLIKRRPRQAVEHFRLALRINPDYLDAHENLGATLRSLGRAEEALEPLRRAVALAPDRARTRLQLANLLAASKRHGEALEHYRAAIELEPDNAEARRNLGMTLASLGRLVESVGHFRRSIELDPNAHRAHYNLAVVLKALGRAEQAVPHFRAALRLNPDWPEALVQLAWILAVHPDEQVRDADEAVRLAEQSAALTKGVDSKTLDTLAAAYASAGRFDEAVATCARALALAGETAGEAWRRTVRERLELYRQGRAFREKPLDSGVSPLDP